MGPWIRSLLSVPVEDFVPGVDELRGRLGQLVGLECVGPGDQVLNPGVVGLNLVVAGEAETEVFHLIPFTNLNQNNITLCMYLKLYNYNRNSNYNTYCATFEMASKML